MVPIGLSQANLLKDTSWISLVGSEVPYVANSLFKLSNPITLAVLLFFLPPAAIQEEFKTLKPRFQSYDFSCFCSMRENWNRG